MGTLAKSPHVSSGPDGYLGKLDGKAFTALAGNGQRMRMEFLRDTFYGRSQLIGGPSDGEIWGVQAWKAYRTEREDSISEITRALYSISPPTTTSSSSPFRIANAGIVQYAGGRTLGEVSYDLVYVTWRDADPQLDVDQYIVWIGRSTEYGSPSI